jgi:hypothetical protein
MEDSRVLGLSLHGCVEQGEVALDCCPNRYGITLPVLGTALNVGEKEGDGAGREIGHDPFQKLSWVSFYPIVT